MFLRLRKLEKALGHQVGIWGTGIVGFLEESYQNHILEVHYWVMLGTGPAGMNYCL